MPHAAPTTAPVTLPPAERAILRTHNLHRILGEGEAAAHVLKGVDVAIAAKSYVSLVGASGSGKSTLLYLLGALDHPSQRDLQGKPFDPPSRVLVDDADTSQLDEAELASLRNHKIGFVFQFHYLLKEFTAQENVCLPMFKLAKLSRDQAMDRGAMLLSRLGLGSKLKRLANRLSGGEQQRVAIARALANEPAVLLADEPTGNLDRHNSQIVADVLREIAAGGQTIVMVTHDTQLARQAHRMITMEDGRILHDERLNGSL